MSRRIRSAAIETFLHHVERAYITGQDKSSGPAVLMQMCDMLTAVLNGENVDESLGITRREGPDEQPHTLPLAYLTHQWRHADPPWPWAAIEAAAKDWMQRQGLSPLSESALRKNYKLKRPEIERIQSIQEFMNLLGSNRT